MKSRLFCALLGLCSALFGVLDAAAQSPTIVAKDPAPGPLNDLPTITVYFSETVAGVDASDLLVNGRPADSVQPANAMNSAYIFSIFERPSPNGGNVHISWAELNGIADVDANPFDRLAPGAEWDYTISDIASPQVVSNDPPNGSVVVSFTQLSIRFSEAVVGVEPRDLLIDGVPATGLSGGGDSYTFTFPRPLPGGGDVVVSWAFDNNITDLSSNLFLGFELYVYRVADIVAPVLRELAPNGVTLPFTEVRATFSEGVTNVDASDLFFDGQPALSVTNFTNTTYIFTFAPQRRGTARLEWADGHGITDLSSVPSPFAGGSATVFNQRNYAIVVDPASTNTFVVFSNRFFTGVGTIDALQGRKWIPVQNFFITQRVGQVALKLPTNDAVQLRFRALSVAPGNAQVNLAKAYGDISTVAGGSLDTNAWQASWEGTNATDVHLSEPCCVVSDEAGNIYVAERTGHAVDKITPDGRIFTFMGRRQPGFDSAHDTGTNSGPSVLLNTPSGLFILNNVLYVLDAGNSRVRWVDLGDPNLFVGRLFIDTNGIGPNARGLSIGLNKSGVPNEALYGVGGTLRIWEGTVTNLATGFGEIGFVMRNPKDDIVVTDPPNNRVYEVGNKGRWGEDTVLAGTGFPHGNSTGGDADEVALPGARGVAYLPIGGYFVGLDEGARVWYVDGEDNATPFILGGPGVHQGDGGWFHARGKSKLKISHVESIHIAFSGDILLVEGGVVRKIRFLRHR